jgi:hypothetical protein
MTAYSLTDVVSVDNFPAVQTITGSVSVTGITLSGTIVFPPTIVVTGSGPMVVAGQDSSGVVHVLKTDVSGALYVIASGSLSVSSTPAPASTSNITVFTGSKVSTTFLVANPARMAAVFTNDDFSSGSVYLKFGAVASTGSYTVKLKTGAYYESTFGYVGRIDGVWDTTEGTLFVTELMS